MYIMLDCKKIYIDSRFKTDDSRSDSDFFVELPRTLNIPDNCVCYIDDIVIPLSWNTVDARNNKLYVRAFYLKGETRHTDFIVELPIKNYSGIEYAAALKTALNSAVGTTTGTDFETSYELDQNLLTIVQTNNFADVLIYILSDDDVVSGALSLWDAKVPKGQTYSMNGILRINKTVKLTRDEQSYTAYIDLHGTRNLYLTSSSLASYNIMSNFKNDVIIKKIPVRANYGQMIFDGASNGYDYLQLSKRTVNRLDFRLEDSYGNIMNLNGNHWSFSLIFQIL